MTIGQIEKKYDRIRTLRWLEGIRDGYVKAIARIDKEGEHFTITGIGFRAHSEVEVIDINPHRSIHPNFLRNGLAHAVNELNEEIEQLKNEIEK